MQIGRYGSLLGFAVQLIGAGVALASPDARAFGYWLVAIGALVFLAASVVGVYSRRTEIRAWARQVGTAQIALLVGIAGTWLFMTTALGAVAWIMIVGPGLGKALVTVQDDPRPLRFSDGLEVNGNISQIAHFIIFRGWNASDREVLLKSANIISAINGALLHLKVDAGADGWLPIIDVGLVPVGAQIKLMAQFNPPDGIQAHDFLKVWRQFFLNVEDEKNMYRIPLGERQLAVFFPGGMIGPHISKK